MKRMGLLHVILIGAAAGSVVFYCMRTIPKLHRTEFDDAYMFLRYAKHWLSGAGFSWNSGEGPSYGTTSVSFLLVVTAVRGLTNLSDTMVLTTISFAAGLISIVVLTLMGFVFFKSLRRYWAPLLVVPCMALSPLFAIHSTTGMDTTLSLLCNSVFAVSLLFFTERRSKTSLALCLGAAYVAFLTRPDIGLYCLFLPPLFLIADDVRDWRRGLSYAAGFTALLCAHLLAMKAMFGDYVPLPFFAKSAGFYRGYLGAYKWNAALQNYMFLRTSLPFLLVILCFTTRRTLFRMTAILLPTVITYAYYATVIQIMGRDARYYYPTLAFIVLGAFIAADSYLEERSTAPTRGPWLRPSRMVAAFLVLLLLTFPGVATAVAGAWQRYAMGTPTRYRAQKQYPTRATDDLATTRDASTWGGLLDMDALVRHLPPKVVIAASEYGYIGSQNPDVSIIDCVGLHDRYIAHHGFSSNYLFSRMPDIIWIPHQDYSFSIKEILDSPVFAERYDFYPQLYGSGLAVLKNSKWSTQILDALEGEFARMYPGRALSDYRSEPLDALGADTRPTTRMAP